MLGLMDEAYVAYRIRGTACIWVTSGEASSKKRLQGIQGITPLEDVTV